MMSESSECRFVRARRAVIVVTVLSLCLVFLMPPGQGLAQSPEAVTRLRKGIVRISVTSQVPDYRVPWNPGRIKTENGTGFLISGNRILTNAHVVSNARFIALEKENDARQYEAKVRFIAHDCDLAMLEVMDESFFGGMTPLSFGGVPSLNSTVLVMGYPIGGQRLSITQGIVSRIDYQVYTHSAVDQHLAIQIDAAINPGNSGGPVLQGNQVVGVAFQGYSGDVAQNVGYMIPVPVVQRFLQDLGDGRYDRYTDLGIRFFPLLNKAHRRALGLGEGDFGVLVSKVYEAGACAKILMEGDVLISIEGLPIFSNGYVVMDEERVHMAEVVERKFKGDVVKLEIIRREKRMEVRVPLTSPWPFLMQAWHHDQRPRYVVHGGLVFQPLSRNFVSAQNIKNVNVLYHFSHFIEKEIYLKKPEIIVISKILPDPINAYLRPFVNNIVEKINGTEIRTLEDVAAAFRRPVDYDVIHLFGHGRPVVLDRASVEQAREKILRSYGVLKEAYLGDAYVPQQ